MQDGSELDAPDRLEVEVELRGRTDGEADDLFGVLARDGVLGLERVGERGERLSVEPLCLLLVLEARDERADMGCRQLREIALGPGKDARAGVVDLDQAPGRGLDDQRDDQDRLHLHLPQDEELGGVGPRIVGGDRGREPGLEHRGRRRIVGEVVAQPPCHLAFLGARVVGNLAEEAALEARHEAGFCV